MTAFAFAIILSLSGYDLPSWAWSIAIVFAAMDVALSPITYAFYKGLMGE